jgi:hypothetical protein
MRPEPSQARLLRWFELHHRFSEADQRAGIPQIALQRYYAAWLDQGYRPARGCVCPRAIVRGRCRCWHPDAPLDELLGPPPYAGWGNQLQRWRAKDGTRVLTSQPYDFSAEIEAALRRDCDKYGFDYAIDRTASWHYPGHTTLLIMRPRRALERAER